MSGVTTLSRWLPLSKALQLCWSRWPLAQTLQPPGPQWFAVLFLLLASVLRSASAPLPRERLWELFPWFSPPPAQEFEAQLRAKLNELATDAKARGWELKE